MYIEANGVHYHVETYGEGEPVLLLHGFTGACDNWLPFLSVWCTSFKLICIDIIGHGKTESPPESERYQMEKVVKDLFVILKELDVEKLNIVGYSMGGRLALSFAATYPEMVNALILESSSPGLKTESERETRILNDKNLASKILEDGITAFVDYWENIPLFVSQKRLPEEVRQAVREQRLNNNPVGLANSLLGMGTGQQPSLWEELQELNFPILLLCGEEDKKFCKIAEEMDKLLPNSKIMFAEKGGHAFHVEQPRFFGKIVLEYLLTTRKTKKG